MKESANKHIVFVIIACIAMGFVLSRQFYWHKEVKRVTQPSVEEDMALQVNQLYKNNKKLEKESVKLKDEYRVLKAAVDNKDLARTALLQSLTEYQVVTGQIAVQGPGVIITFSDNLAMIQITDLINALRNIGAEAIAINGKRITLNTGWDDNTYTAPLKIEAIGDKTVLKESLERPGGIIEIIGQGKVATNNRITISAK